VEEGIRFTGLLGRDRRTGLVFLECGVDGTSTSTPRMLNVLLLRVVALNAAAAISLLRLPRSLFKKTSTLTRTNTRTFPNQKKTKTTSRKGPKNLPTNPQQKYTQTLSLSLIHTQKKTRDLHTTQELQKKERKALYKRKKHSKTLDAERET
jgi:hypothetical protein